MWAKFRLFFWLCLLCIIYQEEMEVFDFCRVMSSLLDMLYFVVVELFNDVFSSSQ